MPAAGGVSAPAPLKLVVCDQRGVQFVFSIKAQTCLGRLFDMYCHRAQLDRWNVHFVINDGEIVHPESTAACMDLHDGDFIECVFRDGDY